MQCFGSCISLVKEWVTSWKSPIGFEDRPVTKTLDEAIADALRNNRSLASASGPR